MADSYLYHLAVDLANGVSRLPAEDRARHTDFLRSAQNPDGGFSGREGGSDLYYTGFGLRGLAVLNALTPEISERAAGFLRDCFTRHTSVVDFFSLLYSAMLVQLGGGPDVFAGSPGWDERVAPLLESYRTVDGGYAKALGATSGSTYHTFLVALCYQVMTRPLPNAEQAVRFVLSRRREDGGFVELAPMKRSGTNPTAAAVGLLQIAGNDESPALTREVSQGVVNLLMEMPSLEGGFRANSRAPLADLLSTFTGLWTLRQLGALERVDRDAVLAFVKMLELPGGGYRGGLWDEQTDVEYTFYGLGCLGVL